MEKVKVLVIDDEKNILDSIEMVLSYENYDVKTANNGSEGLVIFKEFSPDIVLLDVKMPGYNGIEILKKIKDFNTFSEVIMISGHSGIEEAVEASKLGAFDFLEKPLSSDKLIVSIRNAYEKIKLLKENFSLKSLKKKKYTIIGETKIIKDLKLLIDKVAKTDSTVLITGESGTGKELIAREIHAKSRRKNNNFVQVNCAAIPEELIESELFGHEKGSFTDAYEKRIGKFELANKGTIFLDEIGDLSLKAQAKVLRVLEEGEVQRVGSSEIKNVDVRVIAATNKDLEQEIKQSNFREDLYFRLNVVPIYSPPLRQRTDDIPLLIEHFVNYFSEENNLKRKVFSPDTINVLKEYEWKGNIRELRNLVERLLIITNKKIITISDLPDYIIKNKNDISLDFNNIKTLDEFKCKFEKSFIEYKLNEFKFNLSKTSKELNISRSNLYKKIKEYGIILPENSEAGEGSQSEKSD